MDNTCTKKIAQKTICQAFYLCISHVQIKFTLRDNVWLLYIYMCNKNCICLNIYFQKMTNMCTTIRYIAIKLIFTSIEICLSIWFVQWSGKLLLKRISDEMLPVFTIHTRATLKLKHKAFCNVMPTKTKYESIQRWEQIHGISKKANKAIWLIHWLIGDQFYFQHYWLFRGGQILSMGETGVAWENHGSEKSKHKYNNMIIVWYLNMFYLLPLFIHVSSDHNCLIYILMTFLK